MIDCKYFALAEWRLLEFEKAYAPLDVVGELKKMEQWLNANPKRRKKNYLRFVVGWLAREHARVTVAAVNARSYARVGIHDSSREAPDYSAECEEILAKYPDLAEGA